MFALKFFRALTKGIIYLCALLLLSGILSFFIVTAANEAFGFVSDGEEKTISTGGTSDITELSSVLYSEGVISYPRLFVFYAKHEGFVGKYHPAEGTYTFEGGLSYRELLTLLCEKDAPKEVSE